MRGVKMDMKATDWSRAPVLIVEAFVGGIEERLVSCYGNKADGRRVELRESFRQHGPPQSVELSPIVDSIFLGG